MRKKILYIIIIILAIFVTYIQLNYKKKINIINQNFKKTLIRYSNLDELKRCIEIEEKLRGGKLSEAIVINKENQENTLYNILDKDPKIYSLVVLTSFESCSTCRDQTLKIWNDLYERDSDLLIIILFSEDRKLNNSDARKVKAYLKGMNIKIPFLLIIDTMLFEKLGVSPGQTPLSLILSRDKKIISVNLSSELTIERVVNFSEFFKSLNVTR